MNRPHIPVEPGTVLCLAGWWPKGNDVAGIFIREHVQAIARHRPVLVVYTEVHKGGSWPHVDVAHAHEEGVPVVRITIRTPLRRFGFDRWLVRKAYRSVLAPLHRRAPFALMHVHVRTEATEGGLDLASALQVPVVLTEHNSYYHLGIRALPAAAQRQERMRIRRWLTDPRIRAVMPVSHDLARVLHTDYGVPMERVTVIPNVAAAVFRPSDGPTGDPFRMVTAAVWRPPKDHATFIKALLALPAELQVRCRLDWVGYGPKMEEIKARCAVELPHMDIRFPGRLEKVDLAQLMRQAHVFVLPTTADNLPCVVLESLSCGTPVVSMAVNGVPELVDASNGLLVPPSDPQALADALITCMQAPERFDRRAIAVAAAARYSEQAVGQAIENIHRQVIGPAAERRDDKRHGHN